MLNAAQARNAIKGELIRLGMLGAKCKARTVSFQDLARESRIFVTVSNPTCFEAHQAAALEAIGKAQGFYVQFELLK